ncbi:MAG: hypothetical protein QN131_05995 [Armatimonadota bacterium]|nr:hypothetical protein [Armatimonadota bacterium]
MPDAQRLEKILIAMYILSEGTTRPLKYEDIVVKAFEMFPDDFALRGYSQYPDASDIHKPLYGPLKRAGYVLSANKMFRLTEKGLVHANELVKSYKAVSSDEFLGTGKGERLDRESTAELQRIIESEAFRLFKEEKRDQILDTDFYAYLQTTVRTPRNEFLGRLRTVEDAVNKASVIDEDPQYRMVRELHQFMMEKFRDIIERKRGQR